VRQVLLHAPLSTSMTTATTTHHDVSSFHRHGQLRRRRGSKGAAHIVARDKRSRKGRNRRSGDQKEAEDFELADHHGSFGSELNTATAAGRFVVVWSTQASVAGYWQDHHHITRRIGGGERQSALEPTNKNVIKMKYTSNGNDND